MLKIIKSFSKYTWINIFTTVLFFLIVQTLFFVMIASKQYNKLLLSKTNLISQLAEYNFSVKQSIDLVKNNMDEELITKANQSYNKRKNINNKLLIKYCVIPILITTLILIFIIIYKFTDNKKWSNVETIGLILILGSYLTELYFFFFIVRKYEIIGDHELLYKLFKSLSENIAIVANTTTIDDNTN